MKQNDFIQQRKADWDRFSEIIHNPEKITQHDIPKLFRQLSHDLAVAKSRAYSPAIISTLNELLLRGQQVLYKPSNRLIAPLWRFVSHTLPDHLLQIRHYVIWAHVLFYGFALAGFAATLIEPDFIRHSMPNSQVVSLETMYDPQSEHYAKERGSDSDFLMFGYYIMNNISIAFKSFVGGLLLGIGALYILLFNGLFFGTVSGHIVNIGYSSTFFSFVVTHGAPELTAIVLSAAAGFVIGMHLLRPGQLSRVDALKKAARQTFPIIFGCFLLLVLAAFIEAFWSSSQLIPAELKYLVGGIFWVWILFYIFPRRRHADR